MPVYKNRLASVLSTDRMWSRSSTKICFNSDVTSRLLWPAEGVWYLSISLMFTGTHICMWLTLMRSHMLTYTGYVDIFWVHKSGLASYKRTKVKYLDSSRYSFGMCHLCPSGVGLCAFATCIEITFVVQKLIYIHPAYGKLCLKCSSTRSGWKNLNGKLANSGTLGKHSSK